MSQPIIVRMIVAGWIYGSIMTNSTLKYPNTFRRVWHIRCTNHTNTKLPIQQYMGNHTPSQGVHCSSTVNIHERVQKGYYLEQACTKCTYKRHITIKQEVDIHEVGDKAIEKYM